MALMRCCVAIVIVELENAADDHSIKKVWHAAVPNNAGSWFIGHIPAQPPSWKAARLVGRLKHHLYDTAPDPFIGEYQNTKFLKKTKAMETAFQDHCLLCPATKCSLTLAMGAMRATYDNGSRTFAWGLMSPSMPSTPAT